MPGAINMDGEGAEGMRVNIDKTLQPNAVNGTVKSKPPDPQEIQSLKGHDDANPNPNSNGEIQARRQGEPSSEDSSRMNNLPDEIVHITQGFIPLARLLNRLAQVTHNALQDKVTELAKMPIPPASMNGNSTYSATSLDDTSVENARKKSALLTFAQDYHAKWVKVLVIAEWSRKAPLVSKLIDLKFHIDQQRRLFEDSLDGLINVKRDLTFARLPSPDLKTALQVLSAGTAPWLPDFDYITPPRLTTSQKIKWVDELDTQLSLRLNMEEYDKIPAQFRDYHISSGRVTFKVLGEFEVDLTVAGEDFQKQFWFIDFRFGFQPAPSSLPESLRTYLEACVNDALSQHGLKGCYRFLHEFVLTAKINELKHQAAHLGGSVWTGSLKVEPLHRALAIQYWLPRTEVTSTKSWVLIAINSGKKPNTEEEDQLPSKLEATWYRDGKAIPDTKLDMNMDTLSAQCLLSTVVGHHIRTILSGICQQLGTMARYSTQDTIVAIDTPMSSPLNSFLRVDNGQATNIRLSIEPTTGFFAVGPNSKFSIQHEHRLNNGKDPIEDGVICVEGIRSSILEDELHRRGNSKGWSSITSPLSLEENQGLTRLRTWTRSIWLRKYEWPLTWAIAIFLGASGDQWWLVEADERSRPLSFKARLHLHTTQPQLSNSFWHHLTVLATGIMSQAADVRNLHYNQIQAKLDKRVTWMLYKTVRLPAIEVSISSILQNGTRPVASTGELSQEKGSSELMNTTSSESQPLLSPQWARDTISIRFKGLQSGLNDKETGNSFVRRKSMYTVSYAIIKVRHPARFSTLKAKVDRDVSYNSKSGEFSIRMTTEVGSPMLPQLKTRLKAIDRFVNFLHAMEKAAGAITNEKATLKAVTFSYPTESNDQDVDYHASSRQRWRVLLDLSEDNIQIQLEQGNPHLQVIDLMNNLVNSEGGIAALLAWLPQSLPVMCAIEKIQDSWKELHTNNRGQLHFYMRAMDQIGIRYVLKQKQGILNSQRTELRLEAQLKLRRNELWWHLYRHDQSLEDDFDDALLPVWNGSGEGWRGLSTSATGRPGKGMLGLLQTIDSAMKAMATASDRQGEIAAVAGAKAPATGKPKVKVGDGPKGREKQSSEVVVLD